MDDGGVISTVYVKMHSNPTMMDTDGDRSMDSKDEFPLISKHNNYTTNQFDDQFISELEKLYDDDLLRITKLKSVYEFNQVIDLIYSLDKDITDIANNHFINKSYIQAILFRELSCLGFEDLIADIAVINYIYYTKLLMDNNFDKYFELNFLLEDSSTGYGQIKSKTAISTINWYNENFNIGNNKIYDYENIYDREEIWNKLKFNGSFNIDCIAKS